MTLDAVLDRIKAGAGVARDVLGSLAQTLQREARLADLEANRLSLRLIEPFLTPIVAPAAPSATTITIAILGDPGQTPIAYIHTTSVLVEPRGGDTGATVIISPGSIWFVASLLAPGAPTDGFAGIAFTSAVFSIDGAGVDPNPTEIDLVANESASILIHPVLSEAPVPPATPRANDGTVAVATLPAAVSFTLAPNAITVNRIDDAVATAYGNTIDLNGGPGPVAYDPDTAEIAIRYASPPAPDDVTIGTNSSTAFELTGRATAIAGSYRLPVVRSTSSALGAATGGGALALELGSGLSANWDALESVPLADSLLHVATGVVGVAGHISVRPTVETFALWNASPSDGSAMQTSLTITAPRGALIRANESAASESVTLFGCKIAGHLDRPLLASGNVATLAALTVTYAIVHDASATNLIVVGIDAAVTTGDFRPIEAYVLDNAVLRSRGTHLLVLEGRLAAMQAVSGSLAIASEIDDLTPILPDPYAADLENFSYAANTLVAGVTWTTPGDPDLAFAIEPLTNAANASANAKADVNANGRPSALVGARGQSVALYDVSSAANQFGVVALGSALNPGSISGQELVVNGMSSALFTVPSIAWEPVLDSTRAWFTGEISADDGGLTTVGVLTADLRPLHPIAFIDAFITEFASGDELIADITLPFGLTAQIDTTTGNNSPVPRPTLTTVGPAFAAAEQTGGRQLRLVATHDAPNDRDVLPGNSSANSAYVQGILDDDPQHPIARAWNEDFGGIPIPGGPPATSFVPLSRYDLSGYGASVFSRFNGPDDQSGIGQARFDVIVGRTAYELVQLLSFILPWNVPVVNTTIFERDATGLVLRYNSGWKAKKQGTFAYPGPPVQNSGVQGVFNVNNITPLAGPLVVANLKNFERVTFDADVYVGRNPATFDLLITGGDAAGNRVPGFEAFGSLASRGLVGYLYADAEQVPSLADAIALLDEFGAAGGSLAAEVDIASTGIKMALTGIEVKATRADVIPRTLGVALVGTPHLPRDGSWSVATRSASDQTPQAVDPRSPVPLVRPIGAAEWHIADAADVVNLASPLQPYGFLQSTGANKVFLEHPTVANAGAATNPLNFAQPPKLADVGTLLGSSGILPAIGDLLQFPPFTGMKPSADGLALTQTLATDIDIPDRVLIPLTPVQLLMSSWHDPKIPPPQPPDPPPTPTHITLDLDAAASPRWKITMSNVAFKLGVDGWGGAAEPLIIVHGNVSAQEGSAPTFSGLDLEYGDALSIVKDILTEIEHVLTFLPGGAAAGLDVSFVGSKLRIREKLPIPKLPIGVGFMEDISLDIGFDVDVAALSLSFFVGLGDELAPFHWLVSPLSGTGMLQLGATDTLGVKMQAGIGVGLAIDVAIVSGSASIVIAVQLDATSSPIGVMVLLTGQASVDVLDGLASASLTLTAGVGIKVSPGDPGLLLPPNVPPDVIDFIKQTVVTLSAEVAIGIHLSVCWLVHVDFDGSWEVSETISGATLTALV